MDDIEINPQWYGHKGRWYAVAKVPKHLRHNVRGENKYPLSCGRGVTTIQQARIAINGKVGTKIKETFAKWQKEFDPMIVVAEELVEALYATYQKINGSKVWLKRKSYKVFKAMVQMVLMSKLNTAGCFRYFVWKQQKYLHLEFRYLKAMS